MPFYSTRAYFAPRFNNYEDVPERCFPFDGSDTFRIINAEEATSDPYSSAPSGLWGQTPRAVSGAYAGGIFILNVPTTPSIVQTPIYQWTHINGLRSPGGGPSLPEGAAWRHYYGNNTVEGYRPTRNNPPPDHDLSEEGIPWKTVDGGITRQWYCGDQFGSFGYWWACEHTITKELQTFPGFTNPGGSPNADIQNRFTMTSIVKNDPIVNGEHEIRLADNVLHQDTGDDWPYGVTHTVDGVKYYLGRKVFNGAADFLGGGLHAPSFRIVHPSHCCFVSIAQLTRAGLIRQPDGSQRLIWNVDLHKDPIRGSGGLNYIPRFNDAASGNFAWDLIFLDGTYMAGQEFRINQIYEDPDTKLIRVVPQFRRMTSGSLTYTDTGTYARFSAEYADITKDATKAVLVYHGGG